MSMLELRADRSRHVACVFNRGTSVTHYLAVENGPALTACQMPTDEFERTYYHIPTKGGKPQTPLEFALAYARNEEARKMVPLTPVALRVLLAIMRGQPTDSLTADSLTDMENAMAQAEATGFRKPDGPVATVHKFLDKNAERIKAGTMSRKDCIAKMTGDPKDGGMGLSTGTVLTQCGVWARTNGVQFARPAQAESAKKEKRSAAAKSAKGDGKKAPAKKAAAKKAAPKAKKAAAKAPAAEAAGAPA